VPKSAMAMRQRSHDGASFRCCRRIVMLSRPRLLDIQPRIARRTPCKTLETEPNEVERCNCTVGDITATRAPADGARPQPPIEGGMAQGQFPTR